VPATEPRRRSTPPAVPIPHRRRSPGAAKSPAWPASPSLRSVRSAPRAAPRRTPSRAAPGSRRPHGAAAGRDRCRRCRTTAWTPRASDRRCRSPARRSSRAGGSSGCDGPPRRLWACRSSRRYRSRRPGCRGWIEPRPVPKSSCGEPRRPKGSGGRRDPRPPAPPPPRPHPRESTPAAPLDAPDRAAHRRLPP